ncbi:hypothetical protein A9G38_03230 [Gilliamella sp. Imp1-1]|nr:hypothetical protein A9G38_03230 [Gilliamella apicola]
MGFKGSYRILSQGKQNHIDKHTENTGRLTFKNRIVYLNVYLKQKVTPNIRYFNLAKLKG